MAHFARLNDNQEVIDVIVIDNRDAAGETLTESEQAGLAYIRHIGLSGDWRQTSYNATFRKHYAGIGYTYDAARDAFIPPQPFPSWTLNEDTCVWEPPVPYPDDGQDYTWNETTQSWSPVT